MSTSWSIDPASSTPPLTHHGREQFRASCQCPRVSGDGRRSRLGPAGLECHNPLAQIGGASGHGMKRLGATQLLDHQGDRGYRVGDQERLQDVDQVDVRLVAQ